MTKATTDKANLIKNKQVVWYTRRYSWPQKSILYVSKTGTKDSAVWHLGFWRPSPAAPRAAFRWWKPLQKVSGSLYTQQHIKKILTCNVIIMKPTTHNKYTAPTEASSILFLLLLYSVVVCHAEVTLLYQTPAGLCHFSVPIGSSNVNRKSP